MHPHKQDAHSHSNPTGAAQAEDFGKLAADWWDESGPMAPLHKINPLRALFLDTSIDLAGKKLLDIGCGGGIFAEAMAERGAIVTAIDPSQSLINIAKDHANDHANDHAQDHYKDHANDHAQDHYKDHANDHAKSRNLDISYICADTAELLAQKKFAKHFDIICCLEVLEHLAAPETLVAQASELTKPGGYGYFSTINRTLRSFMLAIVATEYVLRWLPRGTHSHDMFITPAQLCEWLEAADWTPTKAKGINYNVTQMKFELSAAVHTNYLLLAQKNKK